jgi:Ca2+-binding EF-hand superfamily protein
MNRILLALVTAGGLTAALVLPAYAGDDPAPKPGAEQRRGGPRGHRRHRMREATAFASLRRRVLEKFDANKDGSLDESERAAAKAAHEAKRAELRAKVLERFDADKNGTLDDAENAAIRKGHQERRQAFRAKVLERFDADKDGTLDDAERAEAAKARAAKRAEIVAKFDANKDGTLDPTERAAAREALQAEHGAKRCDGPAPR